MLLLRFWELWRFVKCSSVHSGWLFYTLHWNPAQHSTHTYSFLLPNSLHRLFPPQQGLDFEKTGGLMGTALTRLDGLLRQGRQGHMCYIVLFSLVIFLALYWIMSKR